MHKAWTRTDDFKCQLHVSPATSLQGSHLNPKEKQDAAYDSTSDRPPMHKAQAPSPLLKKANNNQVFRRGGGSQVSVTQAPHSRHCSLPHILLRLTFRHYQYLSISSILQTRKLRLEYHPDIPREPS